MELAAFHGFVDDAEGCVVMKNVFGEVDVGGGPAAAEELHCWRIGIWDSHCADGGDAGFGVGFELRPMSSLV